MTLTLADLIHLDSGRLGGTVVFRGTRVPVKALFDYLAAGKTLEQFLADFDGVRPEAARAVLEAAAEGVIRGVSARG